jgi:hypothetical protein
VSGKKWATWDDWIIIKAVPKAWLACNRCRGSGVGWLRNFSDLSETLIELDGLLLNRSGNSPCVHFVDQQNPLSFDETSFFGVLKSVEAQTSVPVSDRVTIRHPLEQVIAQAKLLSGGKAAPILAISGILNAGKTSLIASFLSESGRQRLLIGEANAQGTHRFVVWLPQRWRADEALWSQVLALLGSVFEKSPEELATDPAVAKRQYNAVDSQRSLSESLAIPLVATDPALDEWNLGLMDCPDVQTGIAPVSDGQGLSLPSSAPAFPSNSWQVTEQILGFAHHREHVLRRALKVASAMIVVTAANSLQDRAVDEILSSAETTMPSLKKILAINRVPRRYRVIELSEEVRRAYARFSLWRAYLAYHFDGPLQRDRIPPWPDSHSNLDTAEFPNFFRIDHAEAVQPPGSVPRLDFLVTLGQQLQPSELSRELRSAVIANIERHCREAVERISNHQQKLQARATRLRKIFSEACLSLALNEDSLSSSSGSPPLRLQVSREIIAQIGESLERTAPWWAWPSRQLTRWSDLLRRSAGQVTQWVTLPSWFNEKMESTSQWVRARWRSGEGGRVIAPRAFFEAIARRDQYGDLIRDETIADQSLLVRLNRIIERFQLESRTRLNDTQVDNFTREMWNRMSWSQRWKTGLAPIGLLFAPLVAVMMIPMDFGGTSVLVFASMKELLLAGAASVGLALVSSDQMPKIAEEEAAWQQVSDLFAMTCDEFQIPRANRDELPEVSLNQQRKRLVKSQIAYRPSTAPNASYRCFEISPDFLPKLDDCLIRLAAESNTGEPSR